jgi:hypothetical protein
MKRILFTVVILMTLSSNGYANLIISADSADYQHYVVPVLSGDDNGQHFIDQAIASTIGTDIELYKNTRDGNIDEGAFAGSYNTIYNSDSSLEQNSALITWVNGTSHISGGFLLAKDGNSKPNWYLYNLSTLSWNGTDTIQLEGFFKDYSFSHVTIYGAPVPEPATMLLFGTGIVGLVGVIRKKRS